MLSVCCAGPPLPTAPSQFAPPRCLGLHCCLQPLALWWAGLSQALPPLTAGPFLGLEGGRVSACHKGGAGACHTIPPSPSDSLPCPPRSLNLSSSLLAAVSYCPPPLWLTLAAGCWAWCWAPATVHIGGGDCWTRRRRSAGWECSRGDVIMSRCVPARVTVSAIPQHQPLTGTLPWPQAVLTEYVPYTLPGLATMLSQPLLSYTPVMYPQL